MKHFLAVLMLVSGLYSSQAQEMNPEQLIKIITQAVDSSVSSVNSVEFVYKKTPQVCIYDENANRMRIISPIIKREELEEEQLLNALVANFHSALDVKYALSDEIIWAVFTHPLKELSRHQILDAINQVYSANITFGSTYSSTNLIFPGNTKKREEPRRKKIIQRL
ncbi:MAG: hypothetical protein QM485_09675 [Flavobacteriaceae bacterium]